MAEEFQVKPGDDGFEDYFSNECLCQTEQVSFTAPVKVYRNKNCPLHGIHPPRSNIVPNNRLLSDLPKSMVSDHQQRVTEFMKHAGQEVPSNPIIPSREVRQLRARLIMEEARELCWELGFAAEIYLIERNGEVKLDLIAKESADLSVVNVGTMIACGLKDNPLLEAVDQSNLQKFLPPTCSACGAVMYKQDDQTISYWQCSVGEKTHPIRVLGDGPHRREDGKWVKGNNWVKPDIAKAIGL